MKTLKGIFGSIIGGLMVLFFSGGIIATVLIMAFPDTLSIGKSIWADLRCASGYPAQGSDCVQDLIRKAQDARDQAKSASDETIRKLQAERDQLALQVEQNGARKEELGALSASVKNFTLFRNKTLEFGVVKTGVKFASVLEPEVWSDSWCYLDRTYNELPRHLPLGNKASGKAVVWTNVTETMLRDAGLTDAMLNEARSACQFPEDVP